MARVKIAFFDGEHEGAGFFLRRHMTQMRDETGFLDFVVGFERIVFLEDGAVCFQSGQLLLSVSCQVFMSKANGKKEGPGLPGPYFVDHRGNVRPA